VAKRLSIAGSDKMSIDTQHVIDAIVALDVWPQSKTSIQRRLGDGPTNETWLVSCDQEQYVLRLVKPFAETVGLSLSNELLIVQAAQQKMLAPEIIASCDTRNIVLSRFVAGRTWTADDMHDKNQLTRLAKTLNQLHSLDCEARPLDMRARLQDYAQHSNDSRAGKWRDNALAQLDMISFRDPVVCHNDLTAANIIDNGNLYLIDWEYASMGDPLFDLAVVVSHHELDATTTEHFLSAYLGHSDDNAKADLNHWCDVYQNLLALWTSLTASKR